MPPSHIITRTGPKPAIMFGWQQSGDIGTAHQPPPRSPTLGPRRPVVANTPCALDTGGSIQGFGKMMVAHPTHGDERLRRPVSGSATSKQSPKKLHSTDEILGHGEFQATGRVEPRSRSRFHDNVSVVLSPFDNDVAAYTAHEAAVQ